MVWVYHRTEMPDVPLDDPEFEAKREQLDSLKEFLAGFSKPDGSVSGGLNDYAAPDDFRRQFEQQLRDRLDLLSEQEGSTVGGPESGTVSPVPETPLWKDVPYPGLEVFTPEQSPIFFGRGPEIDQLINLLSDPKVRFLAVVGVSGSGKSSRRDVINLLAWRPVLTSRQLMEGAWRIEDRYGLSWWDALVVSAAKIVGCRYLLTEDLQAGQDLGGLIVVDPFRISPKETLQKSNR